jgi:hypothetical protein
VLVIDGVAVASVALPASIVEEDPEKTDDGINVSDGDFVGGTESDDIGEAGDGMIVTADSTSDDGSSDPVDSVSDGSSDASSDPISASVTVELLAASGYCSQ